MKNNKKILTLLIAISSLLLSACSNVLPNRSSKIEDNSIAENISSEENEQTSSVHEHTFSEWTVSKVATCTEAGLEVRTCSTCRLAEIRPIPALGHSYTEWERVTEPNCENDGEEQRHCLRCNLFETRKVEATGHNFSDWTRVKEPICTEKGQEKRTCSLCNKVENREVAALGHDWHDVKQEDDTSYIAPQIGVAGQRTQICARCQETQIVSIAALRPANPSSITEVPENDFHNLKQYQYLMDENPANYKTYANGSDLSAPNAIKLKFDDLADASQYYIEISEKPNFESETTKQYTTTNKYYDFYNAKLDTTYYYRVSTSQMGLLTVNFKEITTTSLAPRVVYVPDVLNFRDIGGWSSSLVNGAKIRQGMYFRCAQLNQSGYSSTTSKLDSAGKGLAAIKDLGIKVDIDMRDSNNVPSASPANTNDWPVKLVKASVPSGSEPVRWEGGTYNGTNIADQYKTIFNALANCDKEPAMLHCTYGADRTGIATFFLEALLGVSIEDMTRDYLWTQFTKGRNVKYSESDAEFPKWISKTNACDGDNFADKMENHLMSFGIEKATLEHIREIFVPGYVAQA